MRLIDADELRFEIAKYFDGLPIRVHYDMLKMVDEAPTIEADIKCEDCKTIIALKAALEPAKTGKWINAVYDMEFCFAECDQCHNRAVGTGEYIGNGFHYHFPFYCPNCGARMSEGSEE